MFIISFAQFRKNVRGLQGFWGSEFVHFENNGNSYKASCMFAYPKTTTHDILITYKQGKYYLHNNTKVVREQFDDFDALTDYITRLQVMYAAYSVVQCCTWLSKGTHTAMQVQLQCDYYKICKEQGYNVMQQRVLQDMEELSEI